MVINFDRVTKKYPDGTVAVDDLTLEVPDGTLTVFVGPSGCGKTTSMRMINRMIEPTSGTLTVNGDDVTKVDPVKLRLGIGYVIQSAGLMPHQRVVDNVATVPVLRGESRRTPARRRSACSSASAWTPNLANRYPAQLSGGQQQRVGVARALAADPPILLMDEPFSAVDPVVREELQTEILRLQSELQKTIVFVTHDIDEALKLGDKVAVFGRGGVLAAVRRAVAAAVQPGQRFRRRLRRRRPRLPRPAVPARDRAAAARHPVRRRIRDRRPDPGGRRLGAGHQAGRHAVRVDQRRRCRRCTATAARSTTARSRAARCSVPTTRCGRRSTRRCRRRRVSVWRSTSNGRLVGGVRADDVLAALNAQRREAMPKLGAVEKG